MANCILCSTELRFMNTPTFGSGKLSDGGIVCTSCFRKVNSEEILNLKKYTLAEIRQILQEKANKDSQLNHRLDEIKKQIQKLNLSNISAFLGRREVNELPNILATTEMIDHIVQGVYNKGQGILVSTNRRLLFVDKGLFYGLKVEDFPLDKITSIQYETGLLLGMIKIHTSGNISKIENVEKSAARNFAEFVRDKLSQPKEQTMTVPMVSEPNVLDQLEQLAKLKEKGILTEDEFAEQKRKLLEKL